jgi:hypothetical protein
MKKNFNSISTVILFLIILLSGCNNVDSVWVCKPEKGLKIILNIDENAQHATVNVRPKNFVSPTNRDYLFHDKQQFYIANDTLYRIGKYGEWVGTDSSVIVHTDFTVVSGIDENSGFVITSKSDNSMSLSYFGSVHAYNGLITEYVFEKK